MAANRTGPRSRRRPMLASAAVSLLFALAGAPSLSAQIDSFDRARAAQEEGGNGIFSLPRSQDDIARWLRAVEDIESGRFADAAQRLHNLLDNSRRSAGSVPATSPDRFLGLHSAVIRTLRNLPEEGQQAYEKLALREIGYLLRRDPLTLDTADLETIANRFPASTAGRDAILRLADRALERGDGATAEAWLRAADDALPEDDERRDGLETRRSVARLLILGPAGARPGTASVELAELLEPSLVDDPMRGWPSLAGGYDHARQMTDPVGSLGVTHRFPIRAPGFRRNPLPMHAVGDLDGIFINNGLQVVAIDPLRGQVAWESRRPIEGPSFDFDDVEDSINPTMVLAAAVSEDLVVASLQVADEVVGSNQNRQFRTIRVINKIPVRRLFAFDRVTGKQVWSHWDEAGGEIANRYRGHNVAANPVIQGDTIYVPSHDQTGAIEYYLSAYDLHTGEPKWRRLICSSQQEVNMFGNAEQEFAAAPLAIVGGVIYGATNLGVCFAANASDGQVRWLSAYDVIELPPARLHQSDVRDWYFQNNAPVILDGAVVMTPVDSRYALSFDTEDGRPLWRLSFRPDRDSVTIRWMLGAVGDEVWFSGAGALAVRAYQVPTRGFTPDYRVIATSERLGQAGYVAASVGRAGVADNRIWQPSPNGLTVLDEQGNSYYSIDAVRNEELQRHANLLLIDGLAVSVDHLETRIHIDPEGMRREAERRAIDRPDDPAALLRLASLIDIQVDGSFRTAAAERVENLYRRALTAARGRGLSAGNPVFDAIADRLFELGMARARSVAKRDVQRGLELLRELRTDAPRPDAWIATQRTILGFVAGDDRTYLAELDLLAKRHGQREYSFGSGQEAIPVAAWALWRGVDATRDPQAAMLRLQDLSERFGDVIVDGLPAREQVFARMRALIERHGRTPYAPIEQRAAALLDSAENAPERLREVVRRFPHSDSAKRATAILLDTAALSGDLEAASRFFSESLERGSAPPGVLRRLLAAAEVRGNEGLARALARRLVTEHGDETSDFPPDDGATYAEAVADLAAEREALPEVDLQVPSTILRTIAAPSTDKTLRYERVMTAPGEQPPRDLPIYATLENFWLLGFEPGDDSGSGRATTTELPLFRTRVANGPRSELFAPGGRTLVVCDAGEVRGLDYRTGEEIWNVQTEDDHILFPMGLRGGVMALYSRHIRGGDGGWVFAIEAVSGSELWRRTLPDSRTSTTPVLSTPPADDPFADSHLLVLDGATVRALDLLTGLPVFEFELQHSSRAFLGIDDPSKLQVHARRLQSGMRSDGKSVFLTLPQGNNRPGHVLAIDAATGRDRWQWRGNSGVALEMVEPDGHGGLVIVERSSGVRTGRIIRLDKVGIERHTAPLGTEASVRNNPALPGMPLPGTLLIVDRDKSGTPRVVCENLDGTLRSSLHQFPGEDYIGSYPTLGDGFLAVPTGHRSDRYKLHVIDLKLQRSMLPDGPLELSQAGGVGLWRHQDQLVAQTGEGLRLLGSPSK